MTSQRELKVISHTVANNKIAAKIQANNSDEAVGYFKGRFGMVGELIRKNKNGVFVVRSK